MTGFITLIIIGIVISMLINALRFKKAEISFLAIIATTIIAPIIWHAVGYLVDGPKILAGILVTLPISAVVSFLTAVVTTFVFLLPSR